jgi:hypothetical protein
MRMLAARFSIPMQRGGGLRKMAATRAAPVRRITFRRKRRRRQYATFRGSRRLFLLGDFPLFFSDGTFELEGSGFDSLCVKLFWGCRGHGRPPVNTSHKLMGMYHEIVKI